VLVVQTSNASFTDTSQPAQQWSISRLRAIETGRWVLVPSTNGISGIADASGRQVARAPLHEPATLSADVPLADGSTPALRIGGWLELLLGLLGMFGWWRGTRRLQMVRP
jgi:apolipoprotein N-acyltransferase